MTNDRLTFDISDLVGVPFKDGGRGPDGYDCWGLSKEVLSRAGYKHLPDYDISCYDKQNISEHIDIERPRWQRLDAPVAPCLVAIRFNSPVFVNHCATYIGGGRILHIREKTGSVIERLDSPMWRRVIEGFYLPLEG